MKFRVRSHNDVGLVMYGIMLGLRHPLQAHGVSEQRVSFAMCMQSIRRIAQIMTGNQLGQGLDQHSNIINTYLRFNQQRMGFATVDAVDPIRFHPTEFTGLLMAPAQSFDEQDDFSDCVAVRCNTQGHLVDKWDGFYNFHVEVKASEQRRPHLELLCMMQIVCLEYRFAKLDTIIENRTLSMGMWIAAKMYESQGDLAGKNATIDEAMIMRGEQ